MNTKFKRPIEHESSAPELGTVVRVLHQGYPLCYGGDHIDANGFTSCGTDTKVTPMYVWAKCTHGADIQCSRINRFDRPIGFTFDILSH